MMDQSITIYGRADCRQCDATVQHAKKRGIPFSYIDIDDDIAAQARILAGPHRSLPVVEAGEESWAGFRPDLLDKVRANDA